MPIRMKKDDYANEDSPSNGGGGGNQGGGGIPGGGLLTFLLPLLFRNPKLLIIGVILFAGYYFFSKGCNESVVAPQSSEDALYKGCEMKPEEYDKAYVYAALSDREKLPERVTLEKFCPTPQNQGQQGSCVGWGSAYAARSIMEAVATGSNPDNVAFSPSFLYNQIKLPDCQGAYINQAMDVQQKRGALPFKYFAYDENSCSRAPNAEMMQAANNYNIHGYNRLTKSEEPFGADIQAIKQNLAKGGPVVIGMMVGGSFMQEMMGQEQWVPTDYDYTKRGFGGHCMCLIGYDDNKAGGSFQLMNSWGPEWGINGKAWVSYADFKEFCAEAYGVDPLPSKQNPAAFNNIIVDASIISIKPGVKGAARYGNSISLSNGGNFFESQKVAKESLYKIEVSNQNPCYVYVIGEETDKTSYVLFPYTEKHSAFCGITGSRVFPQDYNLSPDGIGNKDYFAIIVSKNPMDIKASTSSISSLSGDFNTKISQALGQRLASNGQLSGNKIKFNYTANDNKDAAFCVIAINK